MFLYVCTVAYNYAQEFPNLYIAVTSITSDQSLVEPNSVLSQERTAQTVIIDWSNSLFVNAVNL